MPSTRSTSPPKSAWPGVSTMLIRVPFQVTAVHFDRIVMPRSRSRSLESIARSATTSPVRNVPACLSRPSTSVVLPWSTWAMMATLRMLGAGMLLSGRLFAREQAMTRGERADLGDELGRGDQHPERDVGRAGDHRVADLDR